MAHQLSALRWSPLASKPTLTHKQRRTSVPCSSIAISSAQNKERIRLKELFEDAYERCRTAPMEGVSFTLENFTDALEKYDFDSEVGTKVKGTVFGTDAGGAYVDITAKSTAYLPLQEACIHRIKHVHEACIVAGVREEFVIQCDGYPGIEKKNHANLCF